MWPQWMDSEMEDKSLRSDRRDDIQHHHRSRGRPHAQTAATPPPLTPPYPPPPSGERPRTVCDLITYGSATYGAATSRLVQQAKQLGWFDRVHSFTPNELTPAFRTKYESVLSLRRGGGYWLWKWDILNQSLARIPEGGFVVYLDAGNQINPNGHHRLLEYFEMIRASPFKNIGFYIQLVYAPEWRYTLPQMFEWFGVQNNRSITHSPQMENNVIIIQKSDHTRRWLGLVSTALEHDVQLTTDLYNMHARTLVPRFMENRHDQSLGSVSRKVIGTIRIRGWGGETTCGSGAGPFWVCRDDGHHPGWTRAAQAVWSG
jgi:hypothetical protein